MQIYESNASYQGYGGGGGFNPVREADKASAMEREFSKKRQRDQLYWQSLERNDQTMIANADQNVRDVTADVQDKLKALEGFSSTVSSFLKDQEKERITGEMEKATMQAWADPMTFKTEIDQFEEGEATLKEGQKIADKAAVDYESKGGSPIIGERLRTGFTGLPQLAYEKARMQRAALEYPMFHARSADYINGAATPEERTARTAQVTQQFLQQSGAMGMNPGLLNKYLFVSMRQHQIKEDMKWEVAQGEAIRSERRTEAESNLYLGMKDGSNLGEAVWDFWQTRISQGVPSAKAREELVQFLTKNERVLTPEALEALEDYTVTWNDGSQRKLGKVLERELDNLKLATADNMSIELEVSAAQLEGKQKEYKVSFDLKAAELAAQGGRFSNADIAKMKADWRKDGLGEPPKFLDDYITNEEADVEQALVRLKDIYEEKGYIVEADLRDVPNAVRNSSEIKKMLADSSPLAGQSKEDKKSFKDRMTGLANDVTGLDGNQRNTSAYYRTLDNINRQGSQMYQQLIRSGRFTDANGNVDYGSALNEVESRMQTIIDKNPGAFTKETQYDPKRSAAGYELRLNELRTTLKTNPSSINDSLIYSTKDELAKAQKKLATGEGSFPAIYVDLARSQKNLTAYDIAQAQLAKAGIKVKPAPVEEMVKKQDSAVQELLNFYNTPKRTERAFTPNMNAPSVASLNKNLTADQRTALNVIGKYESDSVGGYNAVNQIGVAGGRGVVGFSGDYNKLGGRNLTSMTLGEIMSLQAPRSMSNAEWIRQGRLHAVGRYQFIGPTLAAEVKMMGLSPNTKFTPDVQDAIALNHMRRNGISPWVGPSDYATGAERAAVQRVRRGG